ncbi:hypothetical protein [Vibrio tarriae]|uniref:hypothetical protein n=1 Tax=Vibrio tarriae TaxID=2014742 RepID=UPI0015EEB45C|nr:hypothetical protein [Vibrio tarriae]
MSPQRSVLAMAIALTLAACGSDSTQSNPSQPSVDKPSPDMSLTARAADGYLIGANACLDLNANAMCERDEPSATTGENGQFTLQGLTPEQVAKGSLLVEVIADQTKDADYGDKPLTKGYRLSAPPGSPFISPLTTLVHNEIENGRTLEEAKAAVQAKLGTKLDLAADYVAGKSSKELSAADQKEFARLHRIAQVTATIMAENTDKLEQAAANAGISVDKLTSLIATEVSKVLSNVVTTVETAGENFDPIKAGQDIDQQHVGISDKNLEDRVNINEAAKSATEANLAELIKNETLIWFAGEEENGLKELSYGFVALGKNNEVIDQEYQFDYTSGSFVLVTDMTNPEQMILDKEGWETESDAISKITLNNDGSVIFETSNSAKSERISAKRMDLSGLNVASVLEKSADDEVWASGIPQDLTFPSNSYAYLVSSEYLEGGFYTFNKGSWCKEGSPERYAALNQMCNGISAIKNEKDTWIATLAETVAANAQSRDGTTDSVDLIPIAGLAAGDVFAQLLSNGKVVYYSRGWDWNENFVKYADGGEWQDITQYGKTLRKVTLPASIADNITWSNFNRTDNALYFAEFDGFVRVTHFVAQENEADSDYVFDSTAADLIVDKFSQPTPPTPPSPPATLAACLASLPDAGYTKKIGDTAEYAVDRDVNGSASKLTFEYSYQGNSYSWLNDVTLVSGMPSWISDWNGSLEKTIINVKDLDGNLLGYEEAYSAQGYDLGQEGFNPDNSFGWGIAKVALEAKIADADKHLGIPVFSGPALNAPLASFNVGESMVQGLRTVTQQTELTEITKAWSNSEFSYSDTYVGKEMVEVAAGKFDACKVTRKTTFTQSGIEETSESWLTNRGFVKRIRDEQSWNAYLVMEAKSLPASH